MRWARDPAAGVRLRGLSVGGDAQDLVFVSPARGGSPSLAMLEFVPLKDRVRHCDRVGGLPLLYRGVRGYEESRWPRRRR